MTGRFRYMSQDAWNPPARSRPAFGLPRHPVGDVLTVASRTHSKGFPLPPSPFFSLLRKRDNPVYHVEGFTDTGEEANSST
jgi:hypothetical protein